MTGTMTAATQHALDGQGFPRRRSRRLVALALGVLASATSASAEPVVWRLGPDGGRARAILVDPTSPGRLWAASDGGVFTSTDRGERWVRVGLEARRVRSVAVLPTAPGTLLAATDEGVFRRDGNDWVVSREGLCTEEPPVCEDVVQLLADPANALYAYGVLASGAIVRSQDGGRHWNQLTFPTSEAVGALAISTANPPVLLAASPHGGLFRSTTRGSAWQGVSGGLTIVQGGVPRTSYPHAVAFDAARPLMAYAAGTLGAFGSSDGGLTWTTLAAPAPAGGHYVSVGADPLRPGVVLLGEAAGGVQRRGDAGAPWVRIHDGLACVPAFTDVAEYVSFAFERTGAGRAWALSPTDGLRRSDDGGLTWVRGATGMTDARLNSIAVDPTDEWTVFVADARGALLRTTDAGAHWVELAADYERGCPASPQPSRDVPALAGIHPRNHRFLLATLGLSGLRSTDGGETWTTTPIAVADPVAFDHFDARRAIFAHDVTVYRTSDGGATWPRISTAPAPVIALATTSANDALVIAAISDMSGVAVSPNGGFVWLIPTVPPPNPRGHAVAIDPNVPDTLYMAGDGGLAVSTNAGDVWTPVNAGLPITCTTDPQGVVTCDGGPWVLTVDPDDGTVYAGGPRGLFKSENRGTTWAAALEDLGALDVTSLAFGPHGRLLFVGTGNAGAVALEIGDRVPRRRIRRR